MVLQFDFVASVWREILAPVHANYLHVEFVAVNSNDQVVIGA
jgi:hypothetical protein